MQINLTLENAGEELLAGGVTVFGQVFKPGEVAAGAGLTALVSGRRVAAQMDVKSTYEDGSVRMAVVSLERPDLAPGAEAAVVLQTGTAPAAAPVDLAEALAGHALAVDLTGAAGALHVDVLEALSAALANGTASFWQQGPLASQARVEIPLEGSQRLVFDVTAYRGGGLSVEAQFNNDGAMGAEGGRVGYQATVTLDGAVVARESLDQGQYQNWHQSFSTTDHDGGQGLGRADEGWLNIRQDIAHLRETGAIAHYDLALGVSASLLEEMGAATAAAGWGTPLAANGVAQYMPGTGGRADIGFTTEANTAWLMSQDIRAASYAMGQAETASAVPWNLWDAAHGHWLSTDDYPRLWTDARGGSGAPGDAGSGSLTQQADALSGWALDAAHQPDLSYVPYLLTGERWMLDNLQAQAAWNIASQWPDIRGGDADLVVQNNQVRGAAWALRQIDEAAWASPDGSAAKAYFTAASAANWSWIVQQIPHWTEQQGEAHGWLPGDYGTAGALPPWQQDYFASTAIAAARQGNADALTYLEWAANFLVGRFQHADDGFAMHDGAAYLLAISDPATGQPYSSWAEIGAHTAANDWSNGGGWSHSDGDYAQLALATLAGIAELTGSQGAVDAYNALVADKAPFTSAADFRNSPTFAVAAPGAESLPPSTLPVPGEAPPEAAPGLPLPETPEVTPPEESLHLSIRLGAEAWKGNPEAVVLVDGVAVFRGEVAASHASGGQEIALGSVAAGGAHDVVVQFVNDAWGGAADVDRNLYVEDILVNGIGTGHSATMLGNGDAAFTVNAPEPGRMALSIRLGAEAWDGNPEAVVLVDGVAVFRGEVAASHASGGQEIALGSVAAGGAHDVVVQFVNDAWGGAADVDRNLYVEDILVNGIGTGHSATMLGNGDLHFAVGTGHATAASDLIFS
jgi:hypothetical protein